MAAVPSLSSLYLPLSLFGIYLIQANKFEGRLSYTNLVDGLDHHESLCGSSVDRRSLVRFPSGIQIFLCLTVVA